MQILVLVLVVPLLVLVLHTNTKITRTVPHLRNLPEVGGAQLHCKGLPTTETNQNVRSFGVHGLN